MRIARNLLGLATVFALSTFTAFAAETGSNPEDSHGLQPVILVALP